MQRCGCVTTLLSYELNMLMFKIYFIIKFVTVALKLFSQVDIMLFLNCFPKKSWV
jgi:hypothetical protein